MSCPKCGSDSPVEVIIEKRYDGTYNHESGFTIVDWNTCTTDIMIICPDCGEDYPSTCIDNYTEEV